MVVWNVAIYIVVQSLVRALCHPHICLISTKIFLKSLFMLCFQLASIKMAMRCHPCICSWHVIPACAPMNGIWKLVHSAPLNLPWKKNAGGKSRLRSKRSLKCIPPDFDNSWLLVAVSNITLIVRCYRLVEERRQYLFWTISGWPP